MDFVTTIESKTYSTSKGNLSPKDIAKYTDINLFEYDDDKNIAPLLETQDNKLLIISNADELFEISVWLSYKNIDHNLVKNVARYLDKNYFDIQNLLDIFGTKRDVTICTDDYISSYYDHVDDIPKMMSVLDGIMTIKDDKMLELFLAATKKNQQSENLDMQNKLSVMQKHLATARRISDQLG